MTTLEKQDNLKEFSFTYYKELRNAITNYPEEYMYGLEKLDDVCSRMLEAIRNKSFNKDSRAIKAVCKQLNIKHTYTAIYSYLGI
jgi:hypothetical protein